MQAGLSQPSFGQKFSTMGAMPHAPLKKQPQAGAPLFGGTTSVPHQGVIHVHITNNAPAANLIKEEAASGVKTVAKEILTRVAPLALSGLVVMAFPQIAQVASDKLLEGGGAFLKSLWSNLSGAAFNFASATGEQLKANPGKVAGAVVLGYPAWLLRKVFARGHR